MHFKQEHNFALFIFLTEQKPRPLYVILNTKGDTFLKEQLEVIPILIMLVFDDQDSEYFSFLEFKQIIISGFGADLLKHGFQAIFIANIEQTTIAFLVVEEGVHGPGEEEAFEGEVVGFELFERDAWGAAE